MPQPLLLSLTIPAELAVTLAERLRTLRLEFGWKRDTLAERAGVTVSSLRRFEATGKGSFDLVLRVAFALGRLRDLEEIFQPPPVSSIAELERRCNRPVRKRGRV